MISFCILRKLLEPPGIPPGVAGALIASGIGTIGSASPRVVHFHLLA